MNIIDSPSPNHSARAPGTAITLLVLHGTASGFKSAFDWLRRRGSKVSAHYMVARDGTIHRLVDVSRVAWHAGASSWMGRHYGGSVNAFSIGVEFVNDGTEGYTEAQYRAGAWLYVTLADHFPIPLEGIVGHYHVAPNRKTDPWYTFEWGRLFRYISDLRES